MTFTILQKYLQYSKFLMRIPVSRGSSVGGALEPVGGNRSAIVAYPDEGLSNLSGGFPETFADELSELLISDMKKSSASAYN